MGDEKECSSDNGMRDGGQEQLLARIRRRSQNGSGLQFRGLASGNPGFQAD